jgi:glucose/mannose-6-phosphate isomerase
MTQKGSDGASRMRALAASMPSGLLAGFHAGREIAPSADSRPTTLFTVGMGGSGIAGELARGVVESETPLTLAVVRSPDPPRGLDHRSRVILVSYSGNTWETLRAYDAAGRAGAVRCVITSGGELGERAARDGVPLLPVPSGMPPRSAAGYLLGGILGLLDPWFPESNEGRIQRVAERTGSLIATYGRAKGPAASLAAKIGDRFPFVYAESSFLALARRWKTQFEENAKRLAVFDEVPELFHNALVGWDATPKAQAARNAILLLEWAGEGPMTRLSLRYLERLAKSRGAAVLRVPLASEDRLEALVAGISLGDYTSLFLADQRGIDPYPVDAITRLKATLGGPASRAK